MDHSITPDQSNVWTGKARVEAWPQVPAGQGEWAGACSLAPQEQRPGAGGLRPTQGSISPENGSPCREGTKGTTERKWGRAPLPTGTAPGEEMRLGTDGGVLSTERARQSQGCWPRRQTCLPPLWTRTPDVGCTDSRKSGLHAGGPRGPGPAALPLIGMQDAHGQGQCGR